MRRLSVIALVLAMAGSADAAPHKRSIAQLLSGAGTGVSSALILSSFAFASDGNPVNKPLVYSGLGLAAVGPSFGEWYSGEFLTIGMAVRVGAAGLATYALTQEMEPINCQATGQTGCTSIKGAGLALLGLSAIAFIGGMAYDVDDAADANDRYNHRNGYSVAPVLIQPNAPGVLFGGTF